eukprot:scaffold6677_cov155-Skeletonema_menzelii.AAC.8
MPSSSLRCVQLSSAVAEKALQSTVHRKYAAAAIMLRTRQLHKFSHTATLHITTRCISSSHTCFQIGNNKDVTDLHSLYHQQMKEIDSERDAIFGPSSDAASDSQDLSTLAKTYNDQINDTTQSTETVSKATHPTGGLWDAATREEAYEEREALFQFSEDEKNAWSNNGGMQQINASQMQMLRQVMREGPSNQHRRQDTNETELTSDDSVQPFSHLNHQGDGVSMVDVGHKAATRRIATARSSVIFPPEVLSAFQLRTTQERGHRSSEMIGPKGPIFETAKIAGIMAAKRTSDLIPLCHPLPLDRVNIDIQLIDNRAIIECECRVTHKTGVEMEALMGASVAALTIYDMVKAVSHHVEIGSTVLLGKTGGKSDFRAS